MAIYVIGDLHLSGSTNKPMDIFGENWVTHSEKIRNNWTNLVGYSDTVLVLGDISWAMTLEEAMVDLDYIDQLPGKKILLRGNHDYWWSSVKRLNSLYENMLFLQNDYCMVEDIAICGTRGWICPNNQKFTQQDKKIYERELMRLKISFDKAVKDKRDNIYAITHYPPTNDKFEPSGFTDIYEDYAVKKVFYGHLHGAEAFDGGLKGNFNGVEYYLASCDYLDFSPFKVIVQS
ncbi:MAG: metallophosphoesterase [Alkaliphilus sp.]|nr:metallophosphoesterase [Alkaliphilus sp.]